MTKLLRYAPDLLALAAVWVFLLRPRWSRCGGRTLALNTLLYLYLSAVVYVTLMPVLTALPFCLDHPYVPMELMPFRDLQHGYGDAERQILLNVVMTVPFGILLPLSRRCAGKRCGLLRCLLLTAAMSLAIELLQPLLNGARSSDITDLITNTLGGVTGYGLFCLLWRLMRHWVQKI